MARIGDDSQTFQVTGSNFTFQGTRVGDLGATEYTLCTVVIDVTGSTAGFAGELHNMLTTVVDACKKSPRSDNLLLRAVTFSSVVGINELHGFKPLVDIEPAQDYPPFRPDGMTPLCDAAFSAIGAMIDYGAELMKYDFLANGIAFIITDGEDNSSKTSANMVKTLIDNARYEERLESLLSILIGINAANCRDALERFQRAAGIDQYVDAGAATPGNLAKLAAFVSQSVSSQSQALGTGGPSQKIAATI